MSDTDREILNLFLTSSLIVLVLVALVIVFVVNYQRRLWKHKSQLRDIEIEHQKDLLSSAHEAIEATQKRIAADLHDDLGASISTAKLQLNNLEGGEGVNEVLSSSLTSLRRIVNDLMPPTLADFGLKAALQELIKNANQGSIQVELDWLASSNKYDSKTEIVLYRIAQELLNNSLKHSGATHISFTFTDDESVLQLEFHDNGKGFNPQTVKKNVGLLNMASRAQVIGGVFTYRTSPNSGFNAQVSIPKTAKTSSNG
ncbi:MAG: sensor histidine kinase [Flavobacteriia bacterium]|nr:sensor histidine kinase [Flavobacteriia bacterium]